MTKIKDYLSNKTLGWLLAGGIILSLISGFDAAVSGTVLIVAGGFAAARLISTI